MKKSTSYKGTFDYKRDIGRIRIANEDQSFVLTNYQGDVLMVVCDGMGGQNKGDFASKMALDHFVESFKSKRKMPLFFSRLWMIRTLKEANSIIFDEADKNPFYHDMGTTCVAVLIQGTSMIVLNVGDSRAYAYNEFGLRRLTTDQTYVNYLYRSGQIKERERDSRPDRHVLMNALGIYPSINFDIQTMPYTGETILLCSDGLYNNISEPEIRAILSTDERTDQKTATLISEANHNGGSDNVAVALWETIKG